MMYPFLILCASLTITASQVQHPALQQMQYGGFMKKPMVTTDEARTMDGRRLTSRQMPSPGKQQMHYGGFLRNPEALNLKETWRNGRHGEEATTEGQTNAEYIEEAANKKKAIAQKNARVLNVNQTSDARKNSKKVLNIKPQHVKDAKKQLQYGGFMKKPAATGDAAPGIPPASLAQVSNAALLAYLHEKNMNQENRQDETAEIEEILQEQRSGPRVHTAMKIRILCAILGIAGLVGLMALGSRRYKQHEMHEDWIAIEEEKYRLAQQQRKLQEEDDRPFHETFWKFTTDALNLPTEEPKKHEEEESAEDGPLHARLFKDFEDFAKDAFKVQ